MPNIYLAAAAELSMRSIMRVPGPFHDQFGSRDSKYAACFPPLPNFVRLLCHQPCPQIRTIGDRNERDSLLATFGRFARRIAEGRAKVSGAYPHSIRSGKFIVHEIARIPSFRRFKYEHLDLVVCHCAMLGSSRHDTEFSCTEFDHMLAEFDLHAPTPDKKHLILVLVMVPWEHPAELRALDLLAVEFGDDLGPPMFVEAPNSSFAARFSDCFSLRTSRTLFLGSSLLMPPRWWMC